MWRKLHLVYSFFVARRVFSHIVTFAFYCIIIPTSILVPEVTVPKLGVIYIPTTITILNSVGTPRSVINYHAEPIGFNLVRISNRNPIYQIGTKLSLPSCEYFYSVWYLRGYLYQLALVFVLLWDWYRCKNGTNIY